MTDSLQPQGLLTLCATPIGNLSDISLRVLTELKNADWIAAEDTQHTLRLLNHFEIKTPLISYHEHNKKSRGPQLVEKLLDGQKIALVTDAGMPGISDPGEDLVRLCQEAGVRVTAAPGASAGLTALTLSGLSTRRFVFEGFLPAEKKERRAVLVSLPEEERTIVLYEAPHRLLSTIKELLTVLEPERESFFARELTKQYEELRRDTLAGQLAYFEAKPPRGEFVLVIAGRDKVKARQEEQDAFLALSIEAHMTQVLAEGLSEKDAMKRVAKERGVSKRDIYAEWMRK